MTIVLVHTYPFFINSNGIITMAQQSEADLEYKASNNGHFFPGLLIKLFIIQARFPTKKALKSLLCSTFRLNLKNCEIAARSLIIKSQTLKYMGLVTAEPWKSLLFLC